MMTRRTWNTLLGAALAAALGFGVYLRTVENGYTYDDLQIGLQHPAKWEWPGLKPFVTKQYFDLVPELSYRPLVTVSYYFEWEPTRRLRPSDVIYLAERHGRLVRPEGPLVIDGRAYRLRAKPVVGTQAAFPKGHHWDRMFAN